MSDSHNKELEDLNEEFLHVDPLQETYRSHLTEAPEVLVSVEQHKTAFLVIDVQYLDAAPGHGVFADDAANNIPAEAQEYYFKRLDHIVLPNISRLQRHFRSHNMEVIHTRIQSLTRDGRERSRGHKTLGIHAAPGSKEAEFLPEVAPVGDELVINKTASGVFNATNIEYLLRNMGISGLFIAGVYTNECVSTTVRDACDRGFYTTLIDDCCATVTPDLHEATITTLKDRYCRVLSTDQAIREIREMA